MWWHNGLDSSIPELAKLLEKKDTPPWIRRKCAGCDEVLPKDLTKESYLTINEGIYHLKEACLTKGVDNIRVYVPDWNLAKIKETENKDEV
jgi:hypothetical protein